MCLAFMLLTKIILQHSSLASLICWWDIWLGSCCFFAPSIRTGGVEGQNRQRRRITMRGWLQGDSCSIVSASRNMQYKTIPGDLLVPDSVGQVLVDFCPYWTILDQFGPILTTLIFGPVYLARGFHLSRPVQKKERRRKIGDMWHVTRHMTWHMSHVTRDMWHVICVTWCGENMFS